MSSVLNNPPADYILIMWSIANWTTRSVLVPKKEFLSVRGVEYEAMKRDLPKRLYQTILLSGTRSWVLKT